jgi:hypothetical protein
MTVIPVAPDRTRYEVTDENRKVVVSAYENDVKIHYRGPGGEDTKQTLAMEVTVRQGEQVTRDERCAAAAKMQNDGDGKMPLFSTWEAKVVGSGAIAVLTCWALCFGHSDPVSPWKP